MKKLLLLTKTLLAAALLCVGQNAWGAVPFVVKQNGSISDGVITASFKGSNKYCLAIADLSEETGISTAAKVVVEFDTKMSKGARWEIGIGDKSVRGENATGECSGSSYVTNGLIMYFGNKDNNYYLVNGTTYSKDAAFSTTVHATITLDRLAGTYSYTLVDTEGEGGTLFSGSAISTTVSNATIVEAYSWNNASTLTVSDVTVTVTPAYSYTVNAKKSGTLIKQIASGKYLVGDAAIRVAYPQNILKGNTLYSIAMKGSNPRFATTFTPDKDNYSVDLSYDVTPVTDVIYYTEAENITGVSKGSNENYASLDKMGYTWNGEGDEVYKEVLTLPAGKYQIYARGVNGNGSARTCHFKVGTEVKWTFSITNNNTNVTGNSEEFTVAAPTTLYFSCVGSSASGCDWFYIKGTIDEGTNVTGLIENADMETAGSGSGMQEVVKGWNNTDNVVNYRRLTNSSVTNPSGAFTNTYSFENWSNAAGGLTGQMSQTINGLPNGVYKLQLAALVRTVNDQFVYGKSNGKTYKTTLSGANETANDYEVIVVVEDNQLEIGLDMNNSGADWAAIDNARLTYAPDDAVVSVTIGANKFTTFASPYPLDLTSATQSANGFTAYRASAVNDETVTFKDDVNQNVQANTGVLLKGTANAVVSIPVVASGSALADNALQVNATGNTFDAAANTTYYGMNKDSDPLTFGTFDPSSVAIPANKAYLALTSIAAREVRVVFGDITGVANVEAAAEANAKEGKFIENGKLVIVKNGQKFNAAGAKLY